MKIFSLPTELLGDIFDRVLDCQRPSALSPLCLVCRDFLPIVRARLYHTIRISTVEDPTTEAPPHLSTESQQRLTVLSRQPHLSRLVRSISLYMWGGVPDQCVLSVLESLALACPGLQSVDIAAASGKDLEGALSHVRRLKTFKLIAGIWDVDIVETLRPHLELTSLILYGSELPSPGELGEPPSFQLHSLHLNAAFNVLATHLTHHSRHSLRTLDLVHPPDDFDLSSFTGLKSLAMDRFSVQSTEAVVKFAGTATCLNTLSIGAYLPGVALALEQADILRRLPPGLRRLQRDLTFNPSYLLSVLRDSSYLVHLEEMHLTKLAPMPGDGHRTVSEDEKVPVRAAAAARGIKLFRWGRAW